MSERVVELEETEKELQAQLGQQETEADSVIEKWQESYNALEEKNNQLSQELAVSSENEGTLQNKLQETQKELDEAQHKLKDDEELLAKDQGKPLLVSTGMLQRKVGVAHNSLCVVYRACALL